MDNIFLTQLIILFISTLLFFILFLFLSFLTNYDYLNKFIKCSFFSFLLFCYLEICNYENNYLFFTSFIFFILIIFNIHVFFYAPKSSIRFKIISILIMNDFVIQKNKLFKIYNDKIIYDLRIKRLLNSNSIYSRKDYFFINLKKTNLIIFINNILKILFNIK